MGNARKVVHINEDRLKKVRHGLWNRLNAGQVQNKIGGDEENPN